MTLEYAGHIRQVETLRQGLTAPRGTASFNIMGAHGSGKSTLLAYLQQQLLSDCEEWKMPGSDKPRILWIDGQSYTSPDRFIDFFVRNLAPYAADIPQIKRNEEGEITPDDLIEYLRHFTKDDVPLVILIDNFARIMERLHKMEAQGLNVLRQPRIFYVIATDFRSLSQINPPVAAASTFFQDVVEIHLTPLAKREAEKLLCDRNKPPLNQRLDKSDLQTIQCIAGGHPGLLVAALRYFSFQQDVHNGLGDWAKLDKRKQSLLWFLPEDESIKHYLTLICRSFSHLGPSIQEFLIHVAMHHKEEASVRKMLRNHRLMQQLRMMGFIELNDKLEPFVPGSLLEYLILSYVTTANFSEPERAIFDQLRLRQPNLVTFEELANVLEKFIPIEESASQGEDGIYETQRRFVESTLNRVRRKLSGSPNKAAFNIQNERGVGFYIQSLVSFDIFYEKGSKAFASEK